MLIHPDFDPIAFSLGPLKVRWYGLMYLVGFALAWWLGRVRAARPGSGWSAEQVGDLIFYAALGVILGGRLGYVFFYQGAALLGDPLMVLRVWEGGMSFHGGLIGVLVALGLYGRKVGKTFFEVGDFAAPLVPLALAFGRLGNFINGELWGRVTDLPWGMVFHTYGAGDLPRHPSQLYQALLEGMTLFAILWIYSARPRPTMAVSGLFLLGYGVLRSIAELFREPDAHLGYLAFGWLTMGQLLSLPMILAGAGLLVLAYRRRRQEA